MAMSLAAAARAGDWPGEPFAPRDFQDMRVPEAWRRYRERLTWGQGQTLAILDDGCKLDIPEWQVSLPWGPKVIAAWDSVDSDGDPSPVPPGYHGTTVGFPSSLNYQGRMGIAFQNHVAHIRAVTVVHLPRLEADTIAAGLNWVLRHRERLRIRAVNLAPLDDQRHREPVPTAIDEPLLRLREAGVWVSAPCGNHHYTDGISWPACQPFCYGIGATRPGSGEVYLDRWIKTELLAPARATSSANAYAAASAMILAEAIERSGFAWKRHGATLPDAMLAVFRKTGFPAPDPATGVTFRRLDLAGALDYIFGA
jgi:hypothetical protein